MTQQILVRKIRRCVLVGGVVSLEMGFEISKAYLRLHLNLSMSYLKIRKSALQLLLHTHTYLSVATSPDMMAMDHASETVS